MFSKSLTKHFNGFSSEFTKLHATLDADTLLDFAIHRRQNKTWSRKSTHVKAIHVHNTVSHGRLMQQAFGSVTLASPLIFFHQGIKTVIVRELSDTTLCVIFHSQPYECHYQDMLHKYNYWHLQKFVWEDVLKLGDMSSGRWMPWWC
jgi:hypothetical protein